MNKKISFIRTKKMIQKKTFLDPTSSSNNIETDQRLNFMERQFQTIREFMQSLDNRLKSVELHQRGCVLNGKRILSFGEKQQNLMGLFICLLHKQIQ